MHRLAEAVEDRIDGLFGGEIGGVEGEAREAAKMGERPCSDMRLWGGLGGGLGVHNGSLGVPAYAANESRDL